jgi:hypothetical protein
MGSREKELRDMDGLILDRGLAWHGYEVAKNDKEHGFNVGHPALRDA